MPIIATGLREIAQAFRELDREAYLELEQAMHEAGDLIRDDATRRFTPVSVKSARGFETRVRALGSAEALVIVGQRLRKTTGLRPDWGARQVVEALLPARAEKLDDAAELLEERVSLALAEHGF